MKTTVDIPDGLFRRARSRAKQDKTTFREVLSSALREFLGRPRATKKFVLRDASVGGEGPGPEWTERDWEKVRERAYDLPRPW